MYLASRCCLSSRPSPTLACDACLSCEVAVVQYMGLCVDHHQMLFSCNERICVHICCVVLGMVGCALAETTAPEVFCLHCDLCH